MKAKLTRITQNGAMRTKEIVGWCYVHPTVGQPFVIMNNEPIEKDSGIEGLENNNRAVNTSRVVWTQTRFEGGMTFQTETGTDYLFEELKEA